MGTPSEVPDGLCIIELCAGINLFGSTKSRLACHTALDTSLCNLDHLRYTITQSL